MDEICPDCKLIRKPYDGPDFGTPIEMPGMIHKNNCPRVPHLSKDADAKLREDLEEIRRCHRRAWASAHSYVIG